MLVNGVSTRTALADWFFNGQAVSIIDDCTGWQCTQQCGLNPLGYPCAGLPAPSALCEPSPPPPRCAPLQPAARLMGGGPAGGSQA